MPAVGETVQAPFEQLEFADPVRERHINRLEPGLRRVVHQYHRDSSCSAIRHEVCQARPADNDGTLS